MESSSISLEPETTNLCLTGEHVKLWPYMAGVYPRGILGQLWSILETDGIIPHLFWGNQNPPATKMDLPNFCEFVTKLDRQLLFVTTPDGNTMLGCTWWDDIIYGHHAFGSLGMIQSVRGKAALEACRLSSQWAFNQYACKRVWAVTPWKDAASLISGAGYLRVATLPEFAFYDGQPHDVGVYRLPREVPDGQRIS